MICPLQQTIVYLALILFAVSPAAAAEGPPFTAGYKSDPAVLRALKDLKPGHSVVLPEVSVTGRDIEKWRRTFRNGPYVRDFSLKLPYMPDRKTAFYAGANHGAPHVFNDAWEYHLGSNTWHLLFPPDGGDHGAMEKVRKALRNKRGVGKNTVWLNKWFKENVVLRDGTLQTRRGGPIRPWHTWDGLTYDARSKRALWAVMGTGAAYAADYARATGQTTAAVRQQLKNGTGLWMFDFDEGRWLRQTGTRNRPAMKAAGGFLEYLPATGQSVWFTSDWNDDSGMWSYDFVANKWVNLHPNGRSKFYGLNRNRPGKNLVPPQEMQVAYSTKHRLLVAVRQRGAWIYDVDKNAWSKAQEDVDIFAHAGRTVFVYDDRNDLFLLVNPREGLLYAFSLKTKTWRELRPRGAGPFKGKAAGYFDSEHGVLVLLDIRGRAWVYRYAP